MTQQTAEMNVTHLLSQFIEKLQNFKELLEEEVVISDKDELYGRLLTFLSPSKIESTPHEELSNLSNKPYIENETMSLLTLRERQCLEHFIKGRSAKHTAKILNISHRTVEFYLANIKKKYNCGNLRELIYKS